MGKRGTIPIVGPGAPGGVVPAGLRGRGRGLRLGGGGRGGGRARGRGQFGGKRGEAGGLSVAGGLGGGGPGGLRAFAGWLLGLRASRTGAQPEMAGPASRHYKEDR